MTAIGDYFRTALLIDDRAEDDPVDKDDDPSEFSSLTSGGETEPTPGLASPDVGGTPVYSNRLVKAFLNENVVCSVLRPGEEDTIQDMVINGAKIADLLILDWYLFDNDKATIRGITGILNTYPHRLMVVVIYTGAPLLASIVDRLVIECELQKVSDFVLRKGAAVFLIFGKPETTLTDSERNRTAEYTTLPKMIHDDLEDHFGGLVPELAFSGINTIRESAPRVLATFNSSLDVPFLTHRALLSDVSDAGLQFIRLFTSEFETALMESPLTDLLSEGSIKTRLDQPNIVQAPQALSEKLRRSPKIDDALKALTDLELAKQAVAMGLRELGLGDSKLDELLDPIVEAFDLGTEPHELLAALMSSTQFGDIRPRLEAGVVLENESKYWLCIQPLCDSVRLSGSRKFPLLPLLKDGDPGSRSGTAMIRDANGSALRIYFSSSLNPHKLLMPEFEPAKGESSLLAKRDGGAWCFEDTDGTRYRAVCRLRSEFTQQAVQGLTSGVARPGVDSSEWLRRQSR